jgi:Acyl-CoA dehydrogenase, C-terminal domain
MDLRRAGRRRPWSTGSFALLAGSEQPLFEQLRASREHGFIDSFGAGEHLAQVAADAQQHVRHHFDLGIVECPHFAARLRLDQHSAVGGGDLGNVPLVGRGRGKFGFIEDAQKTGILAWVIEEGTEAGDFAATFGADRASLVLDRLRHFKPERWQQFVEQGLTAGKVIVESPLRDPGQCGEAHIQSECARQMNYKAAALHDGARPYGSEASMGKWLAGHAAGQATDRAIQTMGGKGYSKEAHVERLWRDARLFRIAPVSEEMVLNFVAQHDLGMPQSY